MREAVPMPEPELEGLTNFLYEMGLLRGRFTTWGWSGMMAGHDDTDHGRATGPR
jgi:hypothetical protein